MENRKLSAHEYLERYIRTVPGGAIAWERSIFSHTGNFSPIQLVNAAVDLAWDLFPNKVLDIHRAGNYFVIAAFEKDEAKKLLPAA